MTPYFKSHTIVIHSHTIVIQWFDYRMTMYDNYIAINISSAFDDAGYKTINQDITF